MSGELGSFLTFLLRPVLPIFLSLFFFSSFLSRMSKTLTQRTGAVDGESFYKAVAKVNFA